eukprot:IDg13347t1
MGATQSVPVAARKTHSGDGERIALVHDDSRVTDQSAGDVAQESSPRAVNRFSSASPPLRTLRASNSGINGTDPLHTDISSLALNGESGAAPGALTTNVPIPVGTDAGAFRILVLMSETGGGHRASAQALEA